MSEPLQEQAPSYDATALQAAASALSSACDYAFKEDGVGYSKADASWGHLLGELPAEDWSLTTARGAWVMLRKYQKQLARYGVEWAAIPEPPKPTEQEVERAAARRAAWQASRERQRALLTKAMGEGAGAERTATLTGDVVELRFPYNAALVARVKSDLQGRRFDGQRKLWTVPLSIINLEPLLQLMADGGFKADPAILERAAENAQAAMENVADSKAEDAELALEGLGGELRPFQRAGVKYARRVGSVLIADEPGLGKTVQALAAIHDAKALPALVVCPASLKLNWKRETEKWLPGVQVHVLEGREASALPPAGVYVTNYDLLHYRAADLQRAGFKAVVFDESHYLKNGKAKRTKAARELSAPVTLRLLLSGTPALNRPAELVSQLEILGRLRDFGGFWPFVNRYCAAKRTQFGLDISGASHLDELNERLRATCYVRRLKRDVLKELPAKQRVTIPMELSNRKDYEKAANDVAEWLGKRAAEDAQFQATIADLPHEARWAAIREREQSAEEKARRAEQLVRVNTLKRLCAVGKLEGVQEWVETFLESGKKLVLFAYHREVVNKLADTFSAPRITGDTPLTERQAAVDRFQTDASCRLIVLNIEAGGVGLTLTAASDVAFVELPWRPADLDQAEDRCHRIGQESSVTAWYLVASASIDEEISALLQAKRQVVDTVNQGGESVLAAILQRLRSR